VKIKPPQLALMREVVEKRLPEKLALIQSPLMLNASDRTDIQEAISDEFCETGLLPNDEPNKRGLELEDLIDLLGPRHWD